jgi:hypothetical protein
VQIETTNRWDALALARRLPRWYMLEPDSLHWDVCVPLDEPAAELPDELRHLIEAWLRERDLATASVRVGGTRFELERA